MDAPASATLFAVTYRAGPKWRPGAPMREQQGLRDHYFYIKRLYAERRVAAAGQLGPDGGLLLLRARDQTDPERVIAADPAFIADYFTGEAQPLLPRFVGPELLTPAEP